MNPFNQFSDEYETRDLAREQTRVELERDPNVHTRRLLEYRQDWTADEWQKRDGEIAAARVRVRDLDRKKAIVDLVEANWPARSLDVADTATAHSGCVGATVATWDPDERNILVLSGPVGTGKTVAAAWWALRDRLGHGDDTRSGVTPIRPATKRRVTRFVRSAEFAASSRYDHETRDRWFKATALVFDDLGSEYLDAKGSFCVDLDELIDTFYGNKRPLIITTNLDPATFKQRYGNRVADRLRGAGRWIGTGGESLRKPREISESL